MRSVTEASTCGPHSVPALFLSAARPSGPHTACPLTSPPPDVSLPLPLEPSERDRGGADIKRWRFLQVSERPSAFFYFGQSACHIYFWPSGSGQLGHSHQTVSPLLSMKSDSCLFPAVCGPPCLCDFVFENIGFLVFYTGEAALILLLFLWSCAPPPFHWSSEHI